MIENLVSQLFANNINSILSIQIFTGYRITAVFCQMILKLRTMVNKLTMQINC